MMNIEIGNKWLTALRSGKFKQGKSYLRDAKDNYCCLGVLCQMASEAGVIPGPRMTASGEPFNAYLGSIAYPPEEVLEWAGLDDDDIGTPISLNDTGSTFNEIADWIESNLIPNEGE